MTNAPCTIADTSAPAYLLAAEVRELSRMHATLDTYIRSPSFQHEHADARTAMRQQCDAYDRALYWLRRRMQLANNGGNAV